MFKRIIRNYLDKNGIIISPAFNQAGDNELLNNLNDYIFDDLFVYNIERHHFDGVNGLPDVFFDEDPLTGISCFTRISDNIFLKNDEKSAFVFTHDFFKSDKLHIHKKNKSLTTDVFFKSVIKLTPKVSLFSFPLVVFGLLIPFYSNLFNSKLIYSDSLLSVMNFTFVFFIFLLFEMFFKHKVNNVSLGRIEKNSTTLSCYLARLIPSSKSNNISVKIRTIETSASSLWEVIPQSLADIVFMILLSICLVFMLGAYFSILLIYYIIFAFCMIYIRVKCYKSALATRELANEKLSYFISLERKKNELLFMNDEAVSRAVFERNRKDEIDKRQVSEFNHYWAELIKANGFISMVAMFISCYLATANEKMHFLSVIAVLIINSRLSGTLISFVHRVYQILLYRHHIIESYSSLMKDSVRRVNGLDGMLKTSFEMLNLTVKIGNKEIVNNCSIKLVPGDFLGIRGNSGSGKTTLIKTLSAQIEPVGGGVYIDKNNITNLSESFFKNKFAYHTSSSEFISGSLYDNFNFYGIYSYEVMSKFLCLIRNDFEINHEILNVIPASSLPISNGERQRLLILMTLYKRPAVFFMDESTSFLSANDAVDFVNLIRFLYPKTIFVCATHEDKLTELFTHSIDLNVKA